MRGTWLKKENREDGGQVAGVLIFLVWNVAGLIAFKKKLIDLLKRAVNFIILMC